MEILNALNQEFIQIMQEEPGVLGAWEFGSGMHHTRDEYSDIDIVFLVEQTDYVRVDHNLRNILQRICDDVILFWAEDFNGESIKNYDCLLERNGTLCQYDIFLLNNAKIRDDICQIHYADLQKENIFFDKTGAVSSLIGTLPPGKSLQITGLPQECEVIERLIDTYWLHIYMTVKYFFRKDYFKLEGVLRILMDTHTSLLLALYDKTTWGGTANKLHYLPEEKQNHLKKYYCDEDFKKTKDNLFQSMHWFMQDIEETGNAAAVRRCSETADKVIPYYKKIQ